MLPLDSLTNDDILNLIEKWNLIKNDTNAYHCVERDETFVVFMFENILFGEKRKSFQFSLWNSFKIQWVLKRNAIKTGFSYLITHVTDSISNLTTKKKESIDHASMCDAHKIEWVTCHKLDVCMYNILFHLAVQSEHAHKQS